MNAERRRELRELDRALLALCDERARLLASFAIDDPGRAPAVEDLLRRYGGPLDAALVRALFVAIDRATGASSGGSARGELDRASNTHARAGDRRPEDAP